MKNHCTVCDGRLGMWERMWGRFDHPACRAGPTAEHPAPPGPDVNSINPAKTTEPRKGLGIAFRDPAILAASEGKGISAL